MESPHTYSETSFSCACERKNFRERTAGRNTDSHCAINTKPSRSHLSKAEWTEHKNAREYEEPGQRVIVCTFKKIRPTLLSKALSCLALTHPLMAAASLQTTDLTLLNVDRSDWTTWATPILTLHQTSSNFITFATKFTNRGTHEVDCKLAKSAINAQFKLFKKIEFAQCFMRAEMYSTSLLLLPDHLGKLRRSQILRNCSQTHRR